MVGDTDPEGRKGNDETQGLEGNDSSNEFRFAAILRVALPSLMAALHPCLEECWGAARVHSNFLVGCLQQLPLANYFSYQHARWAFATMFEVALFHLPSELVCWSVGTLCLWKGVPGEL